MLTGLTVHRPETDRPETQACYEPSPNFRDLRHPRGVLLPLVLETASLAASDPLRFGLRAVHLVEAVMRGRAICLLHPAAYSVLPSRAADTRQLNRP